MTTTTQRTVARVYSAPAPHWVGDGFRVLGFTSANPELMEAMNPFLLLDYHPPYVYAPTEARRGVGVHPHRGFQTVTLAFEGGVAHHDSAGHGGVIGPGDVQWMSAAGGILHKEYHEAGFARRGGTFHMAQLWVNLPRARKLDPPAYHAIQAAEIPQVALSGPGGHVRVIAGSFAGQQGPARPHTPMALLEVKLEAGQEVVFPLSAAWNASLVLMAGRVSVGGTHEARENELVLLANEGEHLTVVAREPARFLLLAGEPIAEPIVAYGPFVMNTEAEIVQAITDLNQGKFGHLDD